MYEQSISTMNDTNIAKGAQDPGIARGGKQVHRGDSRGVLAFLQVQLQRNVDEEGGKYSEAMAEVYLPPSESTLLRSQWLRHRVQL